jgi:hypothetical protein
MSAANATSTTSAKPSSRSAPTSLLGSTPSNSAGKLGAMIAATGSPVFSNASTRSTSRRGRLASWLQTCTQLPQPMQRWATTSACPASMRIAFAGHSRTQVKQSRQRSRTVWIKAPLMARFPKPPPRVRCSVCAKARGCAGKAAHPNTRGRAPESSDCGEPSAACYHGRCGRAARCGLRRSFAR